MLESVEWGEFRIGDLFEIQKVKQMLSKEYLSEKRSYPVYSSESNNGGVIGYTENPEFICSEEKPVYIIFGDHTRNLNIAKKSFSVLDNVKVLLPKYHSDRVLLFIISVWQKQIPNLGYARHWKVAKDCTLLLPIKNGQINLDFMENFVAELEARRSAELEAYLSAAGLKDYTLTTEEVRALEAWETGQVNFVKFAFREIFDNIKQGRRLKKDDQKPGDIPFVMAGVTNTGVVNHISNPVASFPENSITLDIFGNAFYRSYQYGAGDDTGVYWNTKNSLPKEAMLFLTAAMQKAVAGKFSYGKKLRSSQSLNIKMSLPSENGKPDYAYMQTLISAVQKQVIKDVVHYADEKIAATKTVIAR